MLDDAGEATLYLAGEVVPPGEYVRVDAWPESRVVLAREGRLPASFDGRVAAYQRLPPAPRAPTAVEQDSTFSDTPASAVA
jgi:hypothetical protein